ncbi:MAG: heme-dependent peroxidase [Brockia lithotrophica]|nr:heme-dependent peroxidase [Brockia lithotrophica]
MRYTPKTYEGYHMLHDFRRVDFSFWRTLVEDEQRARLEALRELLAGWAELETRGEGHSRVYAVLGHKADLLFLHFRKSFDALLDAQFALNRIPAGDLFPPAYGYYSVVELGSHTGDPSSDPKLMAELYPTPPKDGYVVFYPMSKKRSEDENWYWMPQEERARMMRSHGEIGRKYAGTILQVVGGSQGLDDWEWSVTLFADDPIAFKKIVYEMRFDEASARYGLFGPFFVGRALDETNLKNIFGI